jgi:hypothetical protein
MKAKIWMKKLVFCGFVLLCSSATAQCKLGVQAGYNSVDFLQYGRAGNNLGNQYSPINAFQAGLLGDIIVGKHLLLDPALLYYGNGAQIVHSDYDNLPGPGLSDFNYTENAKFRLFYLRLQVNLLYGVRLARQINFLAGAGWYIARGLSGTEKGYYSFGLGNGSSVPFRQKTL